MKAYMNDDGAIELVPESTAEVHALRGWEAKFPVLTVHEFAEPLKVRAAGGLKIHTPAIGPDMTSFWQR